MLTFFVQISFTLWVRRATACGARPVVRMASLQLVLPRAKSARLGIIGVARYSYSLRLALHPTARTPHPIQLPFLGLNLLASEIEMGCGVTNNSDPSSRIRDIPGAYPREHRPACPGAKYGGTSSGLSLVKLSLQRTGNTSV